MNKINRIFALFAMLTVAALTFCLWTGMLELSFLKPPDVHGVDNEHPDTPSDAETTATVPDTTADFIEVPDGADAPPPSETGTSETEPDAGETPQESPDHDEIIEQSRPKLTSGMSVRYITRRLNWDMSGFTFKNAADLRKNGYNITDAVYDSSICTIAEVTAPFKLTSVRSGSQKLVEQAVQTKETDFSETVISYTSSTAERLSLEPYMGYIFYDHGDKLYLLDSSGNGMITFNYGDYYPALTRDKEGRPLFYKGSGQANSPVDLLHSSAVKEYYRLADDGRSFVPSDYNDATDNRGLYFDYPAWYGVSDDGTVRLSYLNPTGTDGVMQPSFAYGYSVSQRITGYRYLSAFSFREGYAAVEDTENCAYFINKSGYSTFTYKGKLKNNSGRYVIMNLLMPLTRGMESLGFFYFDHGLARVRERTIDDYSFTYQGGQIYVITDEDYLVQYDGTRFNIPSGYNLVAYSDGVALLEADGKYGYFDHTGSWIAQPVYTYARPFVEGLAALGFGANSVGVIDKSGNIVVPFRYSHVSDCSSGVITAYSQSAGWTIFNKMTKAS